MWESNVILHGISRTYEECDGAKGRIKSTEEWLMFPDLFPRFLRVVRSTQCGKFAHTLYAKRRLKQYKSGGMDGKPMVMWSYLRPCVYSSLLLRIANIISKFWDRHSFATHEHWQVFGQWKIRSLRGTFRNTK